jgi:hypothetical protein
MTDYIDTTEAASVLGVKTNRAALRLLKLHGVPITYGKYGAAVAPRQSVEQLARQRSAMGVIRGRHISKRKSFIPAP